MKYFLVDTENIQKYSFIEEMKLEAGDTVVMMYSNNSKKISITDLKRFIESGATVEFEEVITGTKNALDFQLVTNLALKISSDNNENNNYYIVSNDNGFEPVINYLKNKVSIGIEIIKEPEDNINLLEMAASLETNETAIKIDDQLGLIMKQCPDLSRLHNKLKEVYGNEKGRNIYLEVKKEFKRMKNL